MQGPLLQLTLWPLRPLLRDLLPHTVSPHWLSETTEEESRPPYSFIFHPPKVSIMWTAFLSSIANLGWTFVPLNHISRSFFLQLFSRSRKCHLLDLVFKLSRVGSCLRYQCIFFFLGALLPITYPFNSSSLFQHVLGYNIKLLSAFFLSKVYILYFFLPYFSFPAYMPQYYAVLKFPLPKELIHYFLICLRQVWRTRAEGLWPSCFKVLAFP